MREGHSPNCSATGSVVGIALGSATVAAVILNTYADRFWSWVERNTTGGGDDSSPDDDPPRLRATEEGSVLSWPEPPALLSLDHEATEAALRAGALEVGGAYRGPDAPSEVHVHLTRSCPVACSGCYLAAGPDQPAGVDLNALRSDLEQLAALGVFEVAFGGGETGLGDWVFEAMDLAISLGLTPNLTTSGFGMTAERAAQLSLRVGQVNVSVDGLGQAYRQVRGWSGERLGLKAIRLLRQAGVRVGVNTVITQQTMEALPQLGATLAELDITEWQWLRFKPAGRGRAIYEERALRPVQAQRLWPLALQIEASTGLRLRFDCALVPFLVAHKPPVELLRMLSVTGCGGGDSLWTRTAEGMFGPCSFTAARPVESVADGWREDDVLNRWRARAESPPEPCASCTYREICRGGCRVVAAHHGDELAADPECPRVNPWP